MEAWVIKDDEGCYWFNGKHGNWTGVLRCAKLFGSLRDTYTERKKCGLTDCKPVKVRIEEISDEKN